MEDTISRGKVNAPPRIIVYGDEGVGKSTFAASAPDALFIQTEDGLSQIDCAHFDLCSTLEDVMRQLRRVRDDDLGFSTLVIDSLDFLQSLIFSRVCADYGVKSIEKADGGYGRGFQQALFHWQEITRLLDEIRRTRNMAVILTAHSRCEQFNDPMMPPYSRRLPDLQKLANAHLCAWSDAILYAFKRAVTDATTQRAVAVGPNGGEHLLRTVGIPSCVAKNRYSLPEEIPLCWQAFADGVAARIKMN